MGSKDLRIIQSKLCWQKQTKTDKLNFPIQKANSWTLSNFALFDLDVKSSLDLWFPQPNLRHITPGHQVTVRPSQEVGLFISGEGSKLRGWTTPLETVHAK